MTQAKILKQIQRSKERLSDERDKLRDLINELEEYEGSADEALDHLERAADAISQYL
jgi:hypothetical protein